MKNSILKLLSFSLVAAFVLSACSRDNSVVSNSRIQKRKYTGGFHFESNKKVKSGKEDKEIEKEVIAVVEDNYIYSEVAETENTSSTNEFVLDEITFENSNIQANRSVKKEIEVNNTNRTERITTNSTAANEVQNTKSAKKELVKELKAIKKDNRKVAKNNSAGDEAILYIILCIIIPFVAVGLATDWDLTKVVIALLLSFLFWIPGIIYAFIVCSQEGVI